MDEFTCPVCKVDRPDEPHLDWCDYDGDEADGE